MQSYLTLGLTSIGWFIVAIVYVPITIALIVLLTKWGRSRSFLIGLIAIVTYLPLVAGIAEAVYVRDRFDSLCKEAGITVPQQVYEDGFYDISGVWNWATLGLRNASYRFVEWKDDSGKLWRTERTNDGNSSTKSIETPTARYHWNWETRSRRVGHLLERKDEYLIDTKTGEKVGGVVIGYRYPPFIDAIWMRAFDHRPTMCGVYPNLLQSTFSKFTHTGRTQ